MSMFEDSSYTWRETYFVLFQSPKRPKLKDVEDRIRRLNETLEIRNASADDQGFCDSLTVIAPDDFAALDICYVEGDEVLEQEEALVQDVEAIGCQMEDKEKLEQIRTCDARLDVLHFEQTAQGQGDEPDEMLDPTALLLVLEVLAELTDGIAIDPQGGTLV